MTENFSKIESPTIPKKSTSPSLAKIFGDSLMYSAIQNPVNGTVQLIDHLTASHLLNKVQFIDKPQEAKFNTKQWYAQTLGQGVGTVADLIPLAFGVKGLITSETTAATTGLIADNSALGLSLKESAVTGALYGGILEPSNGNGHNFYLNRMENSFTNALSFSAMTASSIGISKLSESSILDNTLTGKILGSKAITASLSGVPGGVINAEGSSLVNTGKMATGSQIAKSAYTMSLFGLTFAGLSEGSDSLRSKIDLNKAETNIRSNNILDLTRKLIDKGDFRHQFSLNPDLLIPISDTRIDVKSTAPEISKPTPTVDEIRLKSALNKLNQELSSVRLKKDGQYYVYEHTKTLLASMQKDSLISPNWLILPTQAGSPADMIGCDYLLLNRKTGDFHLLDGTSNTQKAENPGAYNVAAIRQNGLIYFEPKWFDAMGKLKLETDKSGLPLINDDISNQVNKFNEDTKNMLYQLTSHNSDFNLTKTPLPSIKVLDPSQTHNEINNFINWLNQESNRGSGNTFGYQDYARTLYRATQHLKIESQLKEADPVQTKTFAVNVSKASDLAVLKYCVDKMLGKNPTVITPNSSLSDVRFQPKQGELNLLLPDQSRFQSPKLDVILSKSTNNLFNSEYLTQLLTHNDGKPSAELERIQKNYPKLTLPEIIRKIQSTAMDNKNYIMAGGASGNGDPIIIQNIVAKLKMQPVNKLLGR